jgi:hypothetical protein
MPADGQAVGDHDAAARVPQPGLEHRWLVEAGGTATTLRPAPATLKERMLKNALHPASLLRFAKRWFVSRWAICTSS